MAEFDVVQYLASKGKVGRQGSGSEVQYPCFFDCNEPADSRKKKLYVNAEDGVYTCFVCGASGGTYLLQKHFGDDPKVAPVEGADPFTRRKILNWAAETGSAMLAHNDDLLLVLMNDRGLSPETILERKLGFIGHGWSLTGSLPETFTRKELEGTGLVHKAGVRTGQDFFYSHLLIPYTSRGHVVQMRGKGVGTTAGGKYMTGPEEQVYLFNTDSLDAADDVIITEGEFDAIALEQHLKGSPEDRVRSIGVVGLAGANGFKDGFESYFNLAKRVYIGLDPDDTGRRAAVQIKEKLGSRARILELPTELPKCDWSEFLLPVPMDATDEWHREHPHAGHGWQDVLALLGNASGKRVFMMSEIGVSWRNQQEAGPRIMTGYTQLDAVLQGFIPGQVLIFLAKTGTGKTIMLCNLAYLMRDRPTLFISLEMTKEEVYERLRRIYLFHHPTATDQTIEFALSKIAICDENQLGDKDFKLLIDEYEVELGERPEVVHVDYLGYYARGQQGMGPYEKSSNAVMQLKREAKQNRVLIISPSQVNRGASEGKPIDLDDARDSGTIEETADFLLSIWRPDDALKNGDDGSLPINIQQSGRLKVDVLKSRHGGKGKTITLLMDLLTLCIVSDGTPSAKRVAHHNYLAWRGETWDQMRHSELVELARGTQLQIGV